MNYNQEVQDGLKKVQGLPRDKYNAVDCILELAVMGITSVEVLFVISTLDGWCQTNYGYEKFRLFLKDHGFQIEGEKIFL